MTRPEVDEVKFAFMCEVKGDPFLYQEAMKSPDAEFWKSAEKQELKYRFTMERNQVWDLVKKP